MAVPKQWRSRIVRYGRMDPAQLLANPKNWRVHPSAQRDALKGTINHIGFTDAVELQDGTDMVLDGHLRVALALQEQQLEIDVVWLDLNDEEADDYLATKDPLSAMAFADSDKLQELMDAVSIQDAAVLQMLADLAEQNGITDFGGGTELLTDPDDVPPVPDDPITKPGDLWLLGRHRLLCGDSTNAGDVARLMDGERADMVWTDPPYGVAIGDKNKWLNTVQGSSDGSHLVGTAPKSSKRVTSNLDNDTINEADLLVLLRGSFGLAVDHCAAGASWYVSAPAGPLHLIWGQVLNELGIWRQTIQWVKNNSTFSPMGVSYHWQAEPIFYGWLPNGGHSYYGDRKQTTVWEIDRPTKSAEHPTMKPVELVARSIQHASMPLQTVLDPFGGSGTTIIAAEQEGRRCMMMELDPHYCDVIRTRWENATGQTATRATETMAAD